MNGGPIQCCLYVIQVICGCAVLNREDAVQLATPGEDTVHPAVKCSVALAMVELQVGLPHGHAVEVVGAARGGITMWHHGIHLMILDQY